MPEFDPNQPFVEEQAAPRFDPAQPFAEDSTPRFDASKPFAPESSLQRLRPSPTFQAEPAVAAPEAKPGVVGQTVDALNNSSNNPFSWMRTGGKFAKAFLTDVFAGNVQPTPTRATPDFPNVSAFWQGKEGPDEKSLPVIQKTIAETGEALPQIGVGTMLTMAGVPPPIAFGGVMGAQAFNDRSDLPMTQRVTESAKQGALGALMPGASELGAKVGGDALTKLALKTGAGDTTVAAAQTVGKVVGSQSLLDGLMAAGQAPELVEQSQNDPSAFRESLIKIVAQNLAFEVPHLPALAREAKAGSVVDAYMTTPEYRQKIDDVATHLLSPRSAQFFKANRSNMPDISAGPASKVPFFSTPRPEAEKQSDVGEQATETTTGIQSPTSSASPAPFEKAAVTEDVLGELQTAMRGNQLKPKSQEQLDADMAASRAQRAQAEAEQAAQAANAKKLAEVRAQRDDRGASDYTLLDAVKEHGGLGGPDLETAMQRMDNGESASAVARTYGDSYDALPGILEELHVAKGKSRARYNELAKAYRKAGFGRGHTKIDQTLDGVSEGYRSGFGFKEGLPESTSDLIESAWSAAHPDNQSKFPTDAEGKAQLFWDTALDPLNKTGLKKINSKQLKVGDTFRLRGKGLSHEEMTVKSIDADTGTVSIKDGPVFGWQDIPEGTDVYVKEHTPVAELRETPDNPNALYNQPAPKPSELRETPTPENLDKNARHFYGKAFDELTPSQQAEIRRSTVDETIPRRQQADDVTRRSEPNRREPVSTATEKPSEPARELQQARPAADESKLTLRQILERELEYHKREADSAGREFHQRTGGEDRTNKNYSGYESGMQARARYHEGQADALERALKVIDAEPKAKPDRIEAALNRAIDATSAVSGKSLEGVLGAPVWVTKAAANGALRVVRAVYLATKNLHHALQAGLRHLRDSNLKGYNEDEARRWIVEASREIEKGGKAEKPSNELQAVIDAPSPLNSPVGNSGKQSKSKLSLPSPVKSRSWQELKDRVEAAGQRLRDAIHQVANRPEGMNKAEAIKKKNSAGTAFEQLRKELYQHPDYVADLLKEHDAAVKELQAAKDAGDESKVIQAQYRVEELAGELGNVPKTLLNKVYFDMFHKEQPSRSEQAAKTELNPELGGDRPKLDEPAEPDKPENRVKQTFQDLPEHLRGVFREAHDAGSRMASRWAAADTREKIAYTKDAAENIGNRVGRQAGNAVLHELNRAFGEKDISTRNQLREQALTFVIESGADRAELERFREVVMAADISRITKREVLNAIRYADTHWDRLTPVADVYKRITDYQVALENEAGIPTLHRDGGYVFHLQDVSANWQHTDTRGGGTGPSAPFRHIRDYPTYADSIASGIKPESYNAVDLLQRRVSLGRKLIGYRGWVESMGSLIDPKSQRPVVTEPVVRIRADGSKDVTAPSGYSIEQFAGQDVAVHSGYDGLFNALTGQSALHGAGWQVALKGAQTAKHLMLVFDTYHLGRLAYWNSLTRGAGEGGGRWMPGKAGYKRGVTLLDNTEADIREMARRGDIPKEWVENLVEDRRLLSGLMDHGLNVGSIVDNIYADWVRKMPIAGQFNRWLFDQYQRGAMTEVGLIEVKRLLKSGMSEQQAFRQAARDINTRFGNLGSQGWVKSKTAQDLARLLFLAPSWNESLIRSEVGAVKQLTWDVGKSLAQGKKPAIGTLGRAAAMAIFGQFMANQLINYATRGHPTWDNPEEGMAAKLSAFVPDYIGSSSGFFINPLTLPAEITSHLMGNAEKTGSVTKAVKSFFIGRLSLLGREGAIFATREDETGAKLRDDKEVLGAMLSAAVPTPIGGSAIYRAVTQSGEKYPGQYEKQVAQSGGLKLDMAPSPQQRIQNLAKEFNKRKGITPSAEFFHGDFYFLDRAVLVGNDKEMKSEIAKVLEKKTAKQVVEHYQRWMKAPFTGQDKREKEFFGTLNDEQQDQYRQARAKRRELAGQILSRLQR